MKILKRVKIVISVFLFFLLTWNAYSTTITIQASGFTFSPGSVTVTVGDTIKWLWVSGTHTTTSTQVPAGASTWDSPLDPTATQFIYKITVAGQYSYDCTFHVAMGMTGTISANPIGIKPISGNVPEKFKLYQNYPNPFNPATNVKFDISLSTQAKLTVYDLTGENVVTLVNEFLQPGSYSVDWDASSFSSGLYFYKLETSHFSETRKMILVK